MSSLLTSTMCILGCTFVLFYFSNFSLPLSLSFFFTTPHFMGHCSIPCCLFVLSPTFPFPSLPHSLSFFFTAPHFMGHCSIPCCLFVLSPTFPFPSLPHSLSLLYRSSFHGPLLHSLLSVCSLSYLSFSLPPSLSLSSLLLLISWAIAPFLAICLFFSPTFPFPSLPHSHLRPVPVTYAWRDELIRKAEKAISKALGKDKPSTSRSALSSRQSSRGAPRQFDHLDDQSVSIYIHVHSYSYVHVPRNVHIMPQSGCVACVTN